MPRFWFLAPSVGALGLLLSSCCPHQTRDAATRFSLGWDGGQLPPATGAWRYDRDRSFAGRACGGGAKIRRTGWGVAKVNSCSVVQSLKYQLVSTAGSAMEDQPWKRTWQDTQV
ncbi:hypothetical protein K456DRAFT_28132 [Colletotrichum gloeosporioides 23]|nr:hypothetical protein K456DRAFT_28132 [Colletotrichum gloeosporioides 23]